MDRLLSEPELESYQAMVNESAGAGTGMIPADLSLLMGHIRAQSALIRRHLEREQELRDALDGLLDYVEHGGAEDYRNEVVEKARAARQRG